MVQTWRIHIRPKAGKADAPYSFGLCLDRGVLGCGWAVDVAEDARLSPEEYLKLNEVEHGQGQSRTVRLLMGIEEGDLIWTRSTTGIYYLGKVVGPWEYRAGREYVDADVVNVRPVRFIEVGTEDQVPGSIVSCFRPSRTLQRIMDETANLYSRTFWGQSSGGSLETPGEAQPADIFSLLSAEDVEDLIFVYLQHLGWIVRPARRRAQTIAYEFTLVDREGREAVVQVKTGKTPVDLSMLPSSVAVAYAFQPNGIIKGSNPVVQVITREEVLGFMEQHPKLLPGTVQVWARYGSPSHTPRS